VVEGEKKYKVIHFTKFILSRLPYVAVELCEHELARHSVRMLSPFAFPANPDEEKKSV